MQTSDNKSSSCFSVASSRNMTLKFGTPFIETETNQWKLTHSSPQSGPCSGGVPALGVFPWPRPIFLSSKFLLPEMELFHTSVFIPSVCFRKIPLFFSEMLSDRKNQKRENGWVGKRDCLPLLNGRALWRVSGMMGRFFTILSRSAVVYFLWIECWQL